MQVTDTWPMSAYTLEVNLRPSLSGRETKRGPLLGPAPRGEAPLRRATPFLAAMLAGFAAVHLQAQESRSASFLMAIGFGVLLVASIPLVPWDKLPSMATALPPLLLVGIVAFLRETNSDTEALTPLILLPVLWLALYDSRIGVTLGISAVALALFVPFIATANTSVVPGERQSALMWLLVAAFTGFAANGLVRDLRERANAFEKTSRLDALTGLQNRRALDIQLPLETKRAAALDYPLCIAMLDLDNFKLFNDHFGHQAGDRLLEEVAERWNKCLRSHDTLVRYGGEEFCAILPNVALDGAVRVAERILEAMPDGQTVSIGVVQLAPAETADIALARADAALYEAKCRGRNRVAALPTPEVAAPAWTLKLRTAARTPEAAWVLTARRIPEGRRVRPR